MTGCAAPLNGGVLVARPSVDVYKMMVEVLRHVPYRQWSLSGTSTSSTGEDASDLVVADFRAERKAHEVSILGPGASTTTDAFQPAPNTESSLRGAGKPTEVVTESIISLARAGAEQSALGTVSLASLALTEGPPSSSMIAAGGWAGSGHDVFESSFFGAAGPQGFLAYFFRYVHGSAVEVASCRLQLFQDTCPASVFRTNNTAAVLPLMHHKCWSCASPAERARMRAASPVCVYADAIIAELASHECAAEIAWGALPEIPDSPDDASASATP